MLGEDLTRESEYLSDPQDGAERDEDADDRRTRPKHGAHRRRSPGPSKVLLGVVLVAATALTVSIVMLLLRRDSTQPAVAPIQQVPSSTTAPSPTPSAAPPAPAPPAAPPPVATAVVETPVVTAVVEPAPVPPPEQATPAIEPETIVAPSPTTRAPISVEPEPRPPFPDQQPPLGGDQRGGGLLGGGGLL